MRYKKEKEQYNGTLIIVRMTIVIKYTNDDSSKYGNKYIIIRIGTLW